MKPKFMSKSINIKLGSNSYKIIISNDLNNKVAEFHFKHFNSRPAVIISDNIVAPFYLNKIIKSFSKKKISNRNIVLPHGEKQKSFSSLIKVTENLLANKISRDTVLYALGGGVIGDLTGFTAAITLRGLDFVQIPTTLLSQVDSSIGGKTGINTAHGKNLIGAFYQPNLVLIDTTTLKTLPKREILSGYAEVVKYALINDKIFFEWLENYGKRVVECEEKFLIDAIHKCCSIKSEVVKKDEKDRNIRAILNFGHTFGHAFEAESSYNNNLRHGEAVSVGMILACKLSRELGYIDKNITSRIESHFTSIGLPTSPKHISTKNLKWDLSKLVNRMKNDKKVLNNKIQFVLMKKIGKAFLSPEVNITKVKRLIMETLQEEN